jgi:hypothetical protein
MIRMIAMIGLVRSCAQRKPIGARIEPIGRYAHGHAHVQTDQVNFCACTCAHMHKTDLPIAPNKWHPRYFIYADETRFLRGSFSYCCTSPQIPVHAAQKIEVMCIIPHHKQDKTTNNSNSVRRTHRKFSTGCVFDGAKTSQSLRYPINPCCTPWLHWRPFR